MNSHLSYWFPAYLSNGVVKAKLPLPIDEGIRVLDLAERPSAFLGEHGRNRRLLKYQKDSRYT